MNTPIQQRIIIFDLDHTLTRYDTYLPFLFGWLFRHPWAICRLIALPIPTLRFLLRRIDNTALKEAYLTAFMGGVNREHVEKWAHRFAENIIKTGLRAQALTRLQEHRCRGDRLILASASLDLYVNSLSDMLRFDAVIASQCMYTHNHKISGRLSGKSLRGEYKLQAIKRFLGNEIDSAVVTVYSDHPSDFPLFQWAGKAIVVNPSIHFAKKSAEHGMANRKLGFKWIRHSFARVFISGQSETFLFRRCYRRTFFAGIASSQKPSLLYGLPIASGRHR